MTSRKGYSLVDQSEAQANTKEHHGSAKDERMRRRIEKEMNRKKRKQTMEHINNLFHSVGWVLSRIVFER